MDYVYVVTGKHNGDFTVVVFRDLEDAQRYSGDLTANGYDEVEMTESEVIE